METFGKLLEKYIESDGITQESLGQKVGYSKSTISNLCKDKVKKIDCGKIEKCAQVLNLNPDERRELMIAANCVPDENDVPLVPIICKGCT